MRIRSVKPDFFVDEDLARLDPLDRITYIGLWCAADKRGRLEDRPQRLGVLILPYEQKGFRERLDRLAAAKFIVRYQDPEGRPLIQIRSWEKHQRPHHTEVESVLAPLPVGAEGEAPTDHGDPTVEKPLGNGEAPDGMVGGMVGGKEYGKGERRRGSAACRTVFTPPSDEEWAAYCSATWPTWPRADALSAIGWYQSHGWKGIVDWKGAAKTCANRYLSKHGQVPIREPTDSRISVVHVRPDSQSPRAVNQ